MTQFYRELDCPDYDAINAEILAWIESQPGLCSSDQFWNPIELRSLLSACPRFSLWCRSLDLRIKTIAVTVGQDPGCCGPHTDTPPARFKLSWPVKNTQGTWNCWYRPRVSQPTSVINQLGGSTYLDRSELEEIGRREVLRPAIIDAGVIHDVVTGPNTQWPRIGLQGQFFTEPQSL